MKPVQIMGLCLAAAFAFSAVVAASAYAEPEFVAQGSNTFPLSFTSSDGKAKLTTKEREIECEKTLDKGVILPQPNATKSMLGDILFTFHNCVLTKSSVGQGTKCHNENEGLVTTPSYLYHLGSLVTLSGGKKDVLFLVLVSETTFFCDGVAIKVTLSGNLVGVVPEVGAGQMQFNKIITKLEIVFKQTAPGKQEFKEFVFTLPIEGRAGLTIMANAGLGAEEASLDVSTTELFPGLMRLVAD